MYRRIKGMVTAKFSMMLHGQYQDEVKYLSFTQKKDDALDEFVDRQTLNPSKRQALDWLAGESSIDERFSLLDVGCGPGAIPQMILSDSNLKERVAYVGVDQSENAIRYCRSRLPDNYVMICQDVLRKALPEDYFDVIMINEVVEHLPSYKKLITDALLKKPKILIITTFAVLSNRKRDRILWNSNKQCFMNSYSFEKFFQHLRSKINAPIIIGNFESQKFDRHWFPRKELMLWYIRLTSNKIAYFENK